MKLNGEYWLFSEYTEMFCRAYRKAPLTRGLSAKLTGGS